MKQLNELQILEKLVNINSVFPKEKNISLELEKILKDFGFKTEKHAISQDRWNLLAERGEGESSILFYGHIDTVPDYGKWKTNPFKLTQVGDKLFGLGACDMKGGIAAFLSAVKLIENKKIKILFSPDEENISEGAWKIVKDKEKWFSDVNFILVGEPGASAKKIGGENVITLGRRGRVVFEIEVFGKSVHGAHPEKGVNAITEASKIALEIEKLKLPSNKYLGNASLFIKKLEGASTSLSIPDKAIIEIDRHLVVPETIDSAKEQIDKLIEQMYKNGKLSKDADSKVRVNIKKRVTPYAPPYVTDINNFFVKKIIQLMNGDEILNYGKSVADDNVFSTQLGLPVITIGPRGDNIHSSNEWVSKKSLENTTKLYKQILEI
jgi:succinyl-diaminopimelate desuccinylase